MNGLAFIARLRRAWAEGGQAASRDPGSDWSLALAAYGLTVMVALAFW